MIKLKIGFSTSRKWMPFSAAIKLVQHTKYSHVFIEWIPIGSEETMIFQASGTSVNLVPKRVFDKKSKTLKYYEFLLTEDEYDEFFNFCLLNLGTEYGAMQAVGIGLANLLGLRYNPFSNGRKAQICSELTAYFLESIMQLDTHLNLEMAGPKEIDHFLETIGRPINGAED